MDVHLYQSLYPVCWENKEELSSGIYGKGVVILFVVLWVRRVWLLRRLSTASIGTLYRLLVWIMSIAPPSFINSLQVPMLYCKRSRTYINHSSASMVNMNLRNVQNISLFTIFVQLRTFNYLVVIHISMVWWLWYMCNEGQHSWCCVWLISSEYTCICTYIYT